MANEDIVTHSSSSSLSAGAASAVRQGGGRHMEYMVLGTLMNIYFLALAHADLLEG